MKMATLVAFSPHGEYLAYSSPDGTLKLWDSDTNSLKQEYTPSSHLSATCTCLSWNSTRRQTETPKRKKRRKSQQPSEASPVDFIAMGTASGSILLYSIVRGELQTEMVGGHSDSVNDICWNSEAGSIYSCSNDQHIVDWDITSGKIKNKWKADKGSVCSVCLCPGGTALLSAGRTIKLWDLEKREVIKTFTGHATDVFRMLYAPTDITSNEGSPLETLNSTYFISAARHDKFINVWYVSSSSKDKNAIASLSLPEEPVSLELSKPSKSDQPFLLSAVSKTGHLVVYELMLNGRRKKPIEPKVTIQIATAGGKDDVPRPIPMLAAILCNGNENSVLLLCHGNFLKPTFEKLPYKSDQSEVCLIREDPSRSKVQSTENDVSKIKTPSTSKEVTVLAPGHMVPGRPSTEETGKKKTKRKLSSSEMSMEERLKAITIDKTTSESSGVIPKADNMAVLLSQGLQSQDKKILNSVLQNTNDKVIQTTVKRLPVPVVVPLVKELSKRMHGHAQSGHTIVKWIKTVLTIHTSYLMTFPELVDSLGSLYQMMDARTTMLTKLSKLQGKLDLVVSQITSQEVEEETTGQQPMLIYQDESSDEDALIDDMVTDHSDSEDNWDVSDMEVNNEQTDEDSEDSD